MSSNFGPLTAAPNVIGITTSPFTSDGAITTHTGSAGSTMINWPGQVEGSAKEPEPMDAQSMTPTDFVLWLNGAIDVLDDTPPTQAQWDKMREKIAGQVGAIVSQRIRTAMKRDAASAYTTGSAQTMHAQRAMQSVQQHALQAEAMKMKFDAEQDARFERSKALSEEALVRTASILGKK